VIILLRICRDASHSQEATSIMHMHGGDERIVIAI